MRRYVARKLTQRLARERRARRWGRMQERYGWTLQLASTALGLAFVAALAIGTPAAGVWCAFLAAAWLGLVWSCWAASAGR